MGFGTVTHNGSSFRDRMAKIAAGVEMNLDQSIRAFANQLLDTLVHTTPIDTGQARVNWQVSIDVGRDSFIQLPGYKKLKGKHTPDTAIVEATTRLGHTIIDSYMNNTQVIYFTSNAPYIQYLNEGSSPQAPAWFIDLALADTFSHLKATKVI